MRDPLFRDPLFKEINMKNNIKKFLCGVLSASFIFSVPCLAFTDVESTSWYYSTVKNMSDKGYLKGYEDGSFKPKNTISAAEFTSIVARIKNISPSAATTEHWASGYMASALENGWYDWDELPPTGEKYNEPISRQLAVKILMKALLPEERGDYGTVSASVKDFSAISGRYYDTTIAAYSAGIVKGDDKGNFNPSSALTRAEACTLIEKALNKTGIAPIEIQEPIQTKNYNTNGISANGKLKVIGTQLCNESGEPVILRGMSTHGLQWFPQYASESYSKALAQKGSNVRRFAMYTAENGYISNPSLKQTLINGVDAALAQDMYAIIDWHILSDNDPMTYKEEAKAFFKEMSEKYKNEPGVIFEICNEPNGNITWSNNVKPYAEEVISVIREAGSDAVILVGSPEWSQRLDEAAKDPLKGENIMYTCHFYAGTHTQFLRDRISSALNSGLPVFISEWGTSSADGNGGTYLEESQKWIDFMNNNGLSWCNWSLCDKNESSAALNPGTDPTDGINENELTESGKFVFSKF